MLESWFLFQKSYKTDVHRTSVRKVKYMPIPVVRCDRVKLSYETIWNEPGVFIHITSIKCHKFNSHFNTAKLQTQPLISSIINCILNELQFYITIEWLSPCCWLWFGCIAMIIHYFSSHLFIKLCVSYWCYHQIYLMSYGEWECQSLLNSVLSNIKININNEVSFLDGFIFITWTWHVKIFWPVEG